VAFLLEPDFEFIAVRIFDEHVRRAWRKFALRSHRAAGFNYRGNGTVDILRPYQSEAKMNDSARRASISRASFKGNDVVWPRTQNLNRAGIAKVLANTKHRCIKAQRSVRIFYCKSDVTQAMRLYHGRTSEKRRIGLDYYP